MDLNEINIKGSAEDTFSNKIFSKIQKFYLELNLVSGNIQWTINYSNPKILNKKMKNCEFAQLCFQQEEQFFNLIIKKIRYNL